jgi:hypothetical protein
VILHVISCGGKSSRHNFGPAFMCDVMCGMSRDIKKSVEICRNRLKLISRTPDHHEHFTSFYKHVARDVPNHTMSSVDELP